MSKEETVLATMADAEFWQFMAWAQRNERRFNSFSEQLRAWGDFDVLRKAVSLN